VSDAPLPWVMRRLPLAVSAAMSLLIVWMSYLALSEGRDFQRGACIVSLVVLAAALAVELVTGGLAFMPRTMTREVFGAMALMAVLGVMLTLESMNYFPRTVRTWEFVIAAVAAFGFFLASQQSFLIHAGLHAFMMFVAALNMPKVFQAASFGGAAAYAALLTIQLAVLWHREKVEDASEPGRAMDAWLPFKASPVPLGILVLLFGIFFVVKPVDGKSLADLWREGRPATAGTLSTGSGLDRALPSEMQPDPFNPFASPAGASAKGETLQVAWMSFQRDLKFGDHGDGIGHPETVIMYVQLRDLKGQKAEAAEVPLYWATGAVTRYDGRMWTGDSSQGRTVDDVQDGARDGRVTLRLPPIRARVESLEQRTIILPLSSRSLFVAYPCAAIDLDQVMIDGDGILSRTGGNDGRFKYTSYARIPRVGPADLQFVPTRHPDPRYVAVPPQFAMDNDVKRVVQEIRGQASTSFGRVDALMRYLGEFKYTMNPGFTENGDPSLECLRARRGYCQHFSSLMALLLRRLEIPSRVCVGFTRGDWNDNDGIYIVRRKHAHAWVEVYFEGVGWIPFDPAGTPLSTYIRAEDLPPDVKPPESKPPDRKPEPPDSKGPDSKQPDSKPPDSKPPGNPDSKPPDSRPGTERTPVPSTPMPLPPAPKGELLPPVDPTGQKSDFDRLWETVNNRAVAAGSMASAMPTSPGAGFSGNFGGKSKLREAAGRMGSLLWTILRDLGLILVGAVIVYAIVARIVRGRRRRMTKRGGVEFVEETVVEGEARQSAKHRGVEAVPRGTRRRRIVELYLDLIHFLSGRGWPRKAAQTAEEYATSMQPAPAGLGPLTGLFSQARYGDREMSEDEVKRSEQAHREAVNEVKRQR